MAPKPIKKRVNTKVTRSKGGKWAKGTVSPNPAGAPKRGMSWREIIDQVGDESLADGSLRKHSVVRTMFEEAQRGNTNAAAWLARYGGGTTEFSELSTEQLRALVALRFGTTPDSAGQGDTPIAGDYTAEEMDTP